MTSMDSICAITGKRLSSGQCISCSALRPSLFQFIQKRHPQITESDCVSTYELAALKADYVEDALSAELGEITDLERDVIQSLKAHEIVSTSPSDVEEESARTFGNRLADKIAEFGGSWAFILSFVGFLVLWLLVNTLVLTARPPDPYPFIFLNLILSCVAAIQAPVIMMSQNRQESRDRHRAEQDYKVNLKAELEIRHLHEKVDHLLHHHAQRLLEIQQIQTDLLRQLVAASGTPPVTKP